MCRGVGPAWELVWERNYSISKKYEYEYGILDDLHFPRYAEVESRESSLGKTFIIYLWHIEQWQLE